MRKKQPTKSLIQQLTAGTNKQRFIETTHHGLAESPYEHLYPYLNLDEIVAFAAGSWQLREKSISTLKQHLAKGPYALFNTINKIGFPQLNNNKKILPPNDDIYKNLNPYEDNTFKERLHAIDAAKMGVFLETLLEPTKQHVFESQYYALQREQRGERLSLMRFQPTYPRKGKIIPGYVKEVSRIIKTYSKEISWGEQKTDGQLALF